MKRVVTVTTVYTITGRDRWLEYLDVVAGQYGAHGPKIAESLRLTGKAKLENREPDGGPDSAITTHAVEVFPNDPKPTDTWPPLACSRAGCHEPRWTATDHLCAAHAREAQEAVNTPPAEPANKKA